jgi:hypothetical protein
MPRLLLTDSPEHPLVLDIDEPVGKGCPNRKLDVYVVQYLLKSVIDSPKTSRKMDILPATPLNIDGIFGERTAEAIRFFQVSGSRGPLAVGTDGRIDPTRGGTYAGSVSGKLRTIILLNKYYYELYGRNAILAVHQHPLFPKELTRALSLSG